MSATATHSEITFSDADLVNPDDFIPGGWPNPENVHAFLLHDRGFTVAVVLAATLQEALDRAADAGRLDRFRVADPDLKDYGPDGDGLACLGNATETYDVAGLEVVEFNNPPFSFVALYNAARP